jgi:hypothetical protein
MMYTTKLSYLDVLDPGQQVLLKQGLDTGLTVRG